MKTKHNLLYSSHLKRKRLKTCYFDRNFSKRRENWSKSSISSWFYGSSALFLIIYKIMKSSITYWFYGSSVVFVGKCTK